MRSADARRGVVVGLLPFRSSFASLTADYTEALRLHRFAPQTCATLMLENGADVCFIQAMLGHANLQTTEIYTHVSICKLKAVHELTHPGKIGKQAGGEEED